PHGSDPVLAGVVGGPAILRAVGHQPVAAIGARLARQALPVPALRAFQRRLAIGLVGVSGGHRAVLLHAPADGVVVRWLRRAAAPAGRRSGCQSAPNASGGRPARDRFRASPMALDRARLRRLRAVAGRRELSRAAGRRHAISVDRSDGGLSAQLHPVLRGRWLVPSGAVSLADAHRVDCHRFTHCPGRLGRRAAMGDPGVLGGAVRLLHVLPRRTGAQQARAARRTGVLLSHGGLRRRPGRRLRRAGSAEPLPHLPGASHRRYGVGVAGALLPFRIPFSPPIDPAGSGRRPGGALPRPTTVSNRARAWRSHPRVPRTGAWPSWAWAPALWPLTAGAAISSASSRSTRRSSGPPRSLSISCGIPRLPTMWCLGMAA